MNRHYLLSLTVATMMGCSTLSMQAEKVHVTTPNTSMLLDATKGKPLRFLHYGERLSDTDVNNITSSGDNGTQAYPAYGLATQYETAMSAIHADGNMTLELVVDKVDRHKDGNKNITTVTMRDKHYPFFVDVNYLTYDGDRQDVIETWVEAWHNEKNPVTLTRFASGFLPVRYGDVWLSQLYGAWGNETRLDEAPLSHGITVIENRDGVRNSQTAHAELMLSLDGKPREESGRVIGAALCYSGNYKMWIDTDHTKYHKLFAGINEDFSHYYLPKGERFVTPPLALTYSDKGIGQVSRNFHRWGRDNRIAHGNDLRKVLLNSWEGVYFKIKEDEMHQMMSDIASMGGELFVMDDGWFGDKYPRNNGTTSLGDWTVDTNKLPHGIQGLIDAAHERGIKFGIWIEPEMTNKVSRLMDEHPEYAIQVENREQRYGRGGSQMVLDMANPKVQDLAFSIVDTLMTKYPGIDYIKWDCNNSSMNHGSKYLPANRQSHLYIEYHKGLEKVFKRVRAKYPDVTIQACASGGGRVNYGVMPYFDEFWTSDNTDALQRIYMQWGTSYFYPAVAMGSHISAVPNHQTSRIVPLKYRIDVAMSGRLGMEIQPKDMNPDEKDMCRKAIAEYKTVRPVIQQGELYRLLSPYDRKGAASLMYVNDAKDDAVFFWWKTENFVAGQYPRIKMSGLDPDRTYTVTELNRIDNKPLAFEGKQFTGRYLMSNGLEIPDNHELNKENKTDYSSRVLRLTAK
ncbi:MAG: alpha-galactosidase [Muribaculaceae bacterium]|nr:alpha-galactosidase [Muribaculaceae bacterium]